MAEVKLTYDGNLFDIPGGRTDGREPATRTAERETFEESGYQAWTSDQAVMTRNRNSADQKNTSEQAKICKDTPTSNME